MRRVSAVIGAKGFIGSHLVAALQAAGDTVKTFVRGQTLDFEGVHVVINCGGTSGGGAFLRDHPLSMVGPNVRLALDVFDAAMRDGVQQVIVLSSTTGYPDRNHPLTESEYFLDTVPDCYRLPGETRRFIERLGRMYPFNVTFLRCAGAYGPGDKFDPDTSHVIGATIRKVAERHNPIICWGDGDDVRDGTYIDDLVSAIIQSIGVLGKQAFNIGANETMTIKTMIRVLCAHAGYSPVVLHDLTKPRMIKSRILDCENAYQVLKWKAKTSMAEGLCRTLDWYANQ